MKQSFLIILMFIVCRLNAQVNLPIQKSANFKLNQKSELIKERFDNLERDETMHMVDAHEIKDKKDSINKLRIEAMNTLKLEAEEKAAFPYRAQIAGLGNFVASQSGDQISPSANIFATLLPFNSPFFKLNFLYNIGVNADSSNIDSVKLGTIFFPDRSRTGFGFRVSYDFFPLLRSSIRKEDMKFDVEPDRDGYIKRDNLEPFIEYSYNKINFRKTHADSSNLQTSTIMLGLAYTRSWEKADNTIGFIITPYFRSVKVTDGTYSLYKKMFAPTIKTDNNPQTVSFIGINTSLQINRFLFSFIYESLQTKALSNTPLDGGVFTVKATVTGEFIRL